MLPKIIVNHESMKRICQLPKLEEEAFKIADWDYFLIPTSEVPATNYHRDEILTEEELPKKYVANSACFRSEAGSAGRDTRDRKSTRLNSSHVAISYAVFCLKK